MKRIPRLIFCELTRRCNLACIHCRAEAADAACADELTTEQVKKNIIDAVKEVSSPILVLTGGEPLMRPDIFEIAQYAAEKNLPTALATNGTLIDGSIARQIKESGIRRVSISIDGIDAATHDSFRGVAGAFDAALRGARILREQGVPFQFNVSVAQRNKDQLKSLLALAKKEGAAALHLFMLVPVGCGIQIAGTEMISAEEYERILSWFSDEAPRSGLEMKATCAPHYYRIIRQKAAEEGRSITVEQDGMAALTKGCLAGSGVCFISHTGEVQPCGYLPLSAGNILAGSFAKIWNESPLLLQLSDEN
ncbi:MAG: radical SAM protein, partial [Spirochaetota bacterium]